MQSGSKACRSGAKNRWRRTIALVAMLGNAVSVCAVDGYFDTNWPPGTGGGRITFTPGLAFNSVSGLAFQPDGKFVLALTTSDATTDFSKYVACVVRLDADGSYDYSFGPAQNGRACLNQFATLPDEISVSGLSLLVQPDGKIVLVGQYVEDIATAHASAFILRLTADGSALDSSAAGGAGFVKFQFGTQAGAFQSVAEQVAVQSDGRIIVAGTGCSDNATPCNQDMAAARFDTALQFDPTFNGNGRTLVGFDLGGNQSDVADALVIASDGKILLAGNVAMAGSTAGGVVRLKADGTTDSTFGSQGRFHFLVNGGALLYAMAIDANGKLVVAGTADPDNAPNSFMLAARILADGSALDTSFGGPGAGYAHNPAGSALVGYSGIIAGATQDLDVEARGVSIRSDGRIVIAGFATEVFSSTQATYFGAARLLPDDGALDLTFGISGRSYGLYVAGGGASYAQALGFAPGNHLMVAGPQYAAGTSATADAGLARLTTDLIFSSGFSPPTNSSP